MTAPDPQALADLVRPPMGEAVLSGDAKVEPLRVPGLPEDSVWEVWVPSNPHMPRLVVGRGPGDQLRLLTGRPEAFAEMVAAVPVSIPDAETALGYVRGFLAATRRHDDLVQVVTDPSEIAWRPGSPDEEERREAFVADTSFAPQVEEHGDGFAVSLVVLRDQHAQLSSFRVTADGRVDAHDEVLVEGLPLPVVV